MLGTSPNDRRSSLFKAVSIKRSPNMVGWDGSLIVRPSVCQFVANIHTKLVFDTGRRCIQWTLPATAELAFGAAMWITQKPSSK